MSQHLKDFAHHLIQKHGPITAPMVHSVFTQLGNSVEGATLEEQHLKVEAVLKQDERLVQGEDKHFSVKQD